jgi:uncharacterized RDD family membrane protein YckC
MKCPKCGYLGFEQVDRCFNCGYDFSLTAPDDVPELPMRDERAEIKPLEDLALVDRTSATVERLSPRNAASSDLPLFGDDVPLITRPSAPRPPLAVRRAASLRPEPARSDAGRSLPMLELVDGDEDLELQSRPAAPVVRPRPVREWTPSRQEAVPEPAAVAARITAAALDLGLLAVVDAAVIYFTIKICGLTTADLHMLPAVPLAAFLLVQNGGYLIAFTAGGQTLGKMAMGIRVVPAAAGAPLDVAHAALRTLVWAALALPAGLGFLTALFNSDRRGLHDRCAGTRVVRASA